MGLTGQADPPLVESEHTGQRMMKRKAVQDSQIGISTVLVRMM